MWFKYSDAPTTGFVIDYTVNNNGARGAAERYALTAQDQGSDQWAAQWSGVFGSSWTGEAMYADYSSLITVAPFEISPLHDGAAHLSQADSFYYNGGQFDGFVDRPRKQAALAATHYRNIGSNSHNFKIGFDWQNTNSSNLFQYPNGQLYIDTSFDLASRAFVPNIRQDYQGGPSTSKGNTYSLYGRDKFDVGSRVFIEAGLRFEYQTGVSDVNADTVDTKTLSPRISSSYDVRGNGKTLMVGSYGRFYQGLLQGFSDSFASVPQQTNYDNFVWNGSSYVFSNRVELGASEFQPNLDLKPTYTDEFTVGAEQQIGQTIGVGVRYIHRDWGNLIDDVLRFRADNTIDRAVVNVDEAERTYRGIEFTFNKRFSNNWNGAVNYTYSSDAREQLRRTTSRRWTTTRMRCVGRRRTRRWASTASSPAAICSRTCMEALPSIGRTSSNTVAHTAGRLARSARRSDSSDKQRRRLRSRVPAASTCSHLGRRRTRDRRSRTSTNRPATTAWVAC